MKKKTKKLTVPKETIRDLTSSNLETVAGGGFNSEWLGCTSNYTC
jgi:natural product precursor